ncbi:uncharacterized protein LOC124371652 [Homalodisca vitripennis]|uniref:uncharacterized protein LOC124365476 n=1 Tax=Homalodisca vitripennis TaxID=197043 RepID=UPI001EEC472E|nr:uncharacterized protein LOC124365476 [Homalodisca vitripennis]XP_046685947.1 uncharacterized protein LOC124371652 [Homalodisca vitripennis]
MNFSVNVWNLVSALNMTAYHLRKDEVEYELQIRGVDHKGSAGELRKRLAQCFSTNIGVDKSIINQLDTEEELEKCEEKYGDLGSLVDEYDGNGKDREFQRLHDRLYHLYIRIERIPIAASANDGMERRKTDLLTKSKNLLQSLQGYKKTSEEEQSTKIGPNVDWSNGELPKKIVSENPYTFCEADVVSSKPCISVAQMPTTASVSAGHTQNVESSLVNRRYFGTKAIPVYKWGLKFDIESGQSVGAFLERVEELRGARGLTHQELFDSAVDLFTGTALIWYRSAVGRVSSWEQLCKELKLVFQSPDYDDMLGQEIRNRVQGPEESIDLFLAAVEGLYGRLSVKVSESERLQQVLKNLNPYLQEKLCMFDIKDMESLRELGRKAELGRLRSLTHHPPQRYPRVLEPDLAWGTPPNRRKTSHLATITSNTSRPSDSSLRCWNCSSLGHRFSQCTRARKVFCYGCGTPGLKKANCSTCQSKNSKIRECTK